MRSSLYSRLKDRSFDTPEHVDIAWLTKATQEAVQYGLAWNLDWRIFEEGPAQIVIETRRRNRAGQFVCFGAAIQQAGQITVTILARDWKPGEEASPRFRLTAFRAAKMLHDLTLRLEHQLRIQPPAPKNTRPV